MCVLNRVAVELLCCEVAGRNLARVAAEGAIKRSLSLEPALAARRQILLVKGLTHDRASLFKNGQSDVFTLDVRAVYQFFGRHAPAVVGIEEPRDDFPCL